MNFFMLSYQCKEDFKNGRFSTGILVLAPMELFEGPKTGHLKVI